MFKSGKFVVLVAPDSIRGLADEAGLSLNKLARLADLDRDTVRNIVGGRHSPTLRTLRKITDALLAHAPLSSQAQLRDDIRLVVGEAIKRAEEKQHATVLAEVAAALAAMSSSAKGKLPGQKG